MFDFLHKKRTGGNASEKPERVAFLSREEIVDLLKASPQAMNEFEARYKAFELVDDSSFFGKSAPSMIRDNAGVETACPQELVSRIVQELLDRAPVMTVADGKVSLYEPSFAEPTVTMEEVMVVPQTDRPMLTANMMVRDMSEGADPAILWNYKMYLTETDPEKKMAHYHMFRQGLDILDLTPVMYEMLGTNPCAMGYWLPKIAGPVWEEGFFKIPATKIMKVPITMLQMSRLQYETLTRSTLDIIDRVCISAFDLDLEKDYFVKTGTFSSKYDFRNAKVIGNKETNESETDEWIPPRISEVRELGEYLLYLSHQAADLAGPLTSPCIYGVSTTNEWVVREFIQDREDNPCIYHGMPLHTEYRVFADFDTAEILGMSPYWREDVMKKNLAGKAAHGDKDAEHDYYAYCAHEETLYKRYEAGKDTVRRHVEEVVKTTELSGQWSIDIMQNGDEFWLIDMAPAAASALSDCVPAGLLKKPEENWLPAIPENAG